MTRRQNLPPAPKNERAVTARMDAAAIAVIRAINDDPPRPPARPKPRALPQRGR